PAGGQIGVNRGARNATEGVPYSAVEHAGQIPPHGLGQKRRKGGDELAGRDEALVQRPISVELVGRLFVGSPKPIAAATDVPVREAIDEFVDSLAGFEVVVLIHPLNDGSGGAIQFAENP